MTPPRRQRPPTSSEEVPGCPAKRPAAQALQLVELGSDLSRIAKGQTGLILIHLDSSFILDLRGICVEEVPILEALACVRVCLVFGSLKGGFANSRAVPAMVGQIKLTRNASVIGTFLPKDQL